MLKAVPSATGYCIRRVLLVAGNLNSNLVSRQEEFTAMGCSLVGRSVCIFDSCFRAFASNIVFGCIGSKQVRSRRVRQNITSLEE
jgi:hypothetical protein